jgi:uncharacterized protein YaeQ
MHPPCHKGSPLSAIGCRMASKATVYVFTVSLADVDRGAYAELELRMARHPSESAEYLLSRLLAYCLEYEEGIVLTDGVSADDEPAVLVRDLTGQVTAWIEVGAPSAERLHRGSKRAKRTAVYTHRDPAQVLALYKGARIHRAEEIRVYSFGRGYLETIGDTLPRRAVLSVSRSGGDLYFDVEGQTHYDDRPGAPHRVTISVRQREIERCGQAVGDGQPG